MDKEQRIKLRAAFTEITRNSEKGIRGVWVARAPKPGPIVGITIMTHGNEPSGLAAYWYFRHVYELKKKLKRGTVYFVLNNIEAGKRYFAAQSNEAKKKTRFVDINMNRLPTDTFARTRDRRYEVRRARELRKIWAEFQYGLDIHSTGQATKPMIVKLKRSKMDLVARFPVTTVISNIDAIQKGKPASHFYGNGRAAVYGIEVGGHETPGALPRAIRCTKIFLASLRMIPKSVPKKNRHQVEYRVFGSVWFPNASYKLVRPLKNFQRIREGQLIARGNGKPIAVPADSYVLMAPKGKKKSRIEEEVIFLAQRSARFRK